MTYAIKRSKNAIVGFGDEQKLLREVYAHAVLQVQPHIVRYYSAWEEENRMLIQSEFCDGTRYPFPPLSRFRTLISRLGSHRAV